MLVPSAGTGATEGAAKSQKSNLPASTAPAGSSLPFKAAACSLQLCKYTTHSRNSLQHSNTGNAAEINLSVTQEVQQSAQH